MRPWVIGFFLLFNAVVLWNALRHPPQVGYDAEAHLAYIEILATGRLPSAGEGEYWSPPLPYALPALARSLGMDATGAAKTGQLLNTALSVGLSLLLLGLCEVMRPGDGTQKLFALGLLGSMAVYAKTFSQVRGEPWVAFLGLAVAYKALVAASERRLSVPGSLALGFLCGLILLARQWGAFVLAGCVLFGLLLVLSRAELWPRFARVLGLSLAVCLLVAAWFYLGLRARHGSLLAFNRASMGFSLANQPWEFYLGTGNGRLFRRPVRPSFPNQAGPILYSEVWGDYWCYFLVWGWVPANDQVLRGEPLQAALAERPPLAIVTNSPAMSAYLGRVNLVALIPTSVFLAGFLLGGWQLARLAVGRAAPAITDLGIALGFAVVAASFAGYAWFLVSYPNLGKGDTIKATYILHIFPFLALLGADILLRLRDRARRTFGVVTLVLVLAALHGVPTLFTRYGPFAPLDSTGHVSRRSLGR